MAEMPKEITVKLEFDSDVFKTKVDELVRAAQIEAWNRGHESGFWNGRQSTGNTEGLFGIRHAEQNNPYHEGFSA